MEKKKSSRASLENKRVIFLEIGLIVALSVLLLAFEWRFSDRSLSGMGSGNVIEIEEMLPVNTAHTKPLPPPPPPKPVYAINEVRNDDPVPEDFPVIDAGATSDTPIPDYFPSLPEEKAVPGEDTVFIVVEKMPEFPGGEAALYKFLRENIQYPRTAREAGISGIVYISFVVEKDGSLSSVAVLRSPHALLSEESLRVMALMPAWNPGHQRGKAVRVQFGLPFRFTLQ